VTKREKLIERIRARPSQARFADVQAVLEDFGWRLRNETGSHAIFIKAGEDHLSIPKVGGRHVKGPYLDLICIRLGLDE